MCQRGSDGSALRSLQGVHLAVTSKGHGVFKGAEWRTEKFQERARKLRIGGLSVVLRLLGCGVGMVDSRGYELWPFKRLTCWFATDMMMQ